MRRTFIIIFSVIVILAIGAGVYFAWKKASQILNPPAVNPVSGISSTTAVTGTNPSSPAPKLTVLNAKPVFDYWSVSTGTSTQFFYLSTDGQILKIKDGREELVSSGKIDNPQLVRVSADGKRIIIKYGAISLPQFKVLDLDKNVSLPLSSLVTAADFSPDSQKLIYLEGPKQGKTLSSLIIKYLNDKNQRTETVLSLIQEDFDLKWFSQNKVIILPKPSALYQSASWIVDVGKKTIQIFTPETSGLMFNWSKDGKTGLRFSTSLGGTNPVLELINDSGQGRVMDFVTFPDKCAFAASSTVFCAIPNGIPQRSVLPDDYLMRGFYSTDYIAQIDAVKNSLSPVFQSTDPAIDAYHVYLTGKKLTFINRYDFNIYSLDL